MKQSLSKMKIDQLRELAASLGADKKRLYGTSKTALIVMIHQLESKSKETVNQ